MSPSASKTDAPPAQKLGGIDEIIPGRIAMSKRAFLRLCDSGAAPWGIKLGGRRLWNLTEIDQWIASGCPRVAKKGG